MYGSGKSGSMFTTLSSLVGIIATVSISGPRSRSGWTSAAPSSAAADEGGLDQHERPAAKVRRAGTGTSGSWSIRPRDSHSSGTVSIHSRQAFRISAARSIGQNRAPA